MRRRLVLVAAVGGVAALSVIFGVGASAAGTTAKVGDAAEAWYYTGAVGSCSSPVGCPPVSAPSGVGYPSGTLHVAVAAGQMTDTTYLQPDLASLPSGETAVSGTMTLPLYTASGGGSYNTSAATMEACLATKSFKDGTEGSTDTPPAIDCSVKSPVQVGTNAFTLKLDPFLAAWNNGQPEYGIALIPDPAQTTAASDWHVTFDGRRLSGTQPITSTVTLQPAADQSASGDTSLGSTAPGSGSGSGTGGGTVSAAPPSAVAGPSPAASPTAMAALPTDQGLPSTVSPQSASPIVAGGSAPAASGAQPAAGGTLQTEPAAATGGGGFQYPEVMLLPLAFAGGLIFVVRLLTSDATPKRRPV